MGKHSIRLEPKSQRFPFIPFSLSRMNSWQFVISDNEQGKRGSSLLQDWRHTNAFRRIESSRMVITTVSTTFPHLFYSLPWSGMHGRRHQCGNQSSFGIIWRELTRGVIPFFLIFLISTILLDRKSHLSSLMGNVMLFGCPIHKGTIHCTVKRCHKICDIVHSYQRGACRMSWLCF